MNSPDPDLNKETKPTESNQLNSPGLDEKTAKPTRRAVDSFKQAHGIAKSLFDRAKTGRLTTDAIVLRKYNGDPPFNQNDLIETGQDWRNNYSTNWLASVIDRVKPQFLNPILNTETLTNASLPSIYPKGAEKSRVFQKKITHGIRRWSGWDDFTSILAQEVVTHGHEAPAWLDDNWRPQAFRVDEVCMPEGTGQHASKVPVFCIKQTVLLHDFLRLIENWDAADVAGYKKEGCVKAANTASTTATKDDSPTKLEDARRENTSEANLYENQNKVVELYHTLVLEYGGGVDLWTTTQSEGHGVRYKKGIHSSMEEAITLFTLQTGNTKFYGSKGLGRMLVNIHIAIERGRCLASDQQYLSGLTILLGDQAKFNSFRPTVMHPFVLVDKSFELGTEQIIFKAQDFEMMDSKLNQLGESIAGAFVPPNIDQGGAPNTKIEAAQKAEREIAVREGVLGRFVGQCFELVGVMQRKICSSVNIKEARRIWLDKQEKQAKGLTVIQVKAWKLIEKIKDEMMKMFAPEIETKIADADAVRILVEMMDEGLTVAEIAALAVEPAAPEKKETGGSKDDATVQFVTANTGNPFQNQAEAYKMTGEIMVGEDRLKRLYNDQDDPTQKAVAQRQQMMELGFIMAGTAMPVAGIDRHDLHRAVIRGEFAPNIPALLQSLEPSAITGVELAASHYLEHIEQDTMMPPDQKKMEEQIAEDWMKEVAQAKIAVAAKAGATSPGSPAGQPGAPGAPQQQPPAEGDLTPKDQADLALRMHEQGLRERDQSIKEKQLGLSAEQQAHQQEMDKISATTKAAQVVADQSRVAFQEGQKAGDKDLQALS